MSVNWWHLRSIFCWIFSNRYVWIQERYSGSEVIFHSLFWSTGGTQLETSMVATYSPANGGTSGRGSKPKCIMSTISSKIISWYCLSPSCRTYPGPVQRTPRAIIQQIRLSLGASLTGQVDNHFMSACAAFNDHHSISVCFNIYVAAHIQAITWYLYVLISTGMWILKWWH